jgi:putative FmdB family regulatory protein
MADPIIGSMPTYEYVCESCGTHVEVHQRFSDEPLTKCGVCGGRLRKVFHPAGILFKGSGFYKTDSRSSRTAAASKSAGDSGSGSKSAEKSTATSGSKTGSKDSGGDSTSTTSSSSSSSGGSKEQSA